MLRKRRRQILEEEEDISEGDYNDALKKDKFMPDMAEFEEDDTGSLLFFLRGELLSPIYIYVYLLIQILYIYIYLCPSGDAS